MGLGLHGLAGDLTDVSPSSGFQSCDSGMQEADKQAER